MTDRLHLTGDDEADRLLATEPMALLIGFALDQQVPVQKAFSGPKVGTSRMYHHRASCHRCGRSKQRRCMTCTALWIA